MDGLYAPGDYLRRLQERAAEARGRPRGDRPSYVVVEKILGPDEQLPEDWPVHGTTGYEFAAIVNGLFVDRRHERAIDDIYARFLDGRRDGRRSTTSSIAARSWSCTRRCRATSTRSAHRLNRFSERNRHFRDFTLYSLISTLKEVIACFPVYRTYVTADRSGQRPRRRYIDRGGAAARSGGRRATPALVFDFIERLLLKQTPIDDAGRSARSARGSSASSSRSPSPVAAKGIEDTAFYVYNRLLSLNEVGGDPTQFGRRPADASISWMADRQRQWPAALSATSTHDTKRGEDVRARLNVLSEMPGAWKAAVVQLARAEPALQDARSAARRRPIANEEYLLYQTLRRRVAVRAARTRQASLRRSVEGVHDQGAARGEGPHELAEPGRGVRSGGRASSSTRCSTAGAAVPRRRSGRSRRASPSWASTTASPSCSIKITAPGVPDFYQGTELWDLTLVDPDNRRPVDYAQRRALLADAMTTGGATVEPTGIACSRDRTDGRIKLFDDRTRAAARGGAAAKSTSAATTCRSRQPARAAIRVFAFARRSDGPRSPWRVPRLVATLVPDAATPPIGAAVWGDTRVELPPTASAGHARSATCSPGVDRFRTARRRRRLADGVSDAIPAGGRSSRRGSGSRS